jgi:hypothetical protein
MHGGIRIVQPLNPAPGEGTDIDCFARHDSLVLKEAQAPV